MKFKWMMLMSLFLCNVVHSQDEYSVESQTRGFSVAADAGVFSWQQTKLDFKEESGFCYGLQASYGINHQWSIYAQTHFASIASRVFTDEDYPVFDGNLGARFYFGSTTSKWRPFLGAQVNYLCVTAPVVVYTTGQPYEMTFTGYGGGASAGIQFYLTNQFSILGIFQANFLGNSSSVVVQDYFTFEKFDIDESYSYSSLRFGVGLSYNFSN